MTTPRARYDHDGNLHLDFDADDTDAPTFPFIRLALTNGLPAETFDWEPGGGTCWFHWRCARTVERLARSLWQDVEVTAAANPHYQNPDLLVQQTREALSAVAANTAMALAEVCK